MIDITERKIENVRLQKCSFKSRSLWKLVVETGTITSRLYDQSTDSSVELYSIHSHSRFFF